MCAFHGHCQTRERWWSLCLICHSQTPHATRKPHGSMFYRTEVIATRSFTLREWRFSTFFVPVTLTLTRQPSYMNMTRIPWRYTGWMKINIAHQGFRKLSYYTLRMHAVMCGHFQSRNRQSSRHLICHSWKPHVHANLMALRFTEPELLLIEVSHCGNRDFRPFLLLWPWPWLGDLHIWTQPINLVIVSSWRYTGCANMNLLRQGFRKLSSDTQTDTTEIMYHATSRVVKICAEK